MSKKAMLKLFNEFNYKYSLWDVFQDFSFIAAACFSNKVDLLNFKKREDEYFRIIKKYEHKDLDKFAKLLAELIDTLDRDQGDILGEIFMELDLGSHFKGQFFTPYQVSLATAELMIGDTDIQKIIDQQGYVTLNEPAVIYHGNTLSMERFDKWVTPSYVLGNWCCEGLRPKPKLKIEIKEDEGGQLKFA